MTRRTLLYRLLWITALLTGAVTCVRMLFGPFTLFGIPVNAPLNPEGIFGAAVTALLLIRPAPPPAQTRPKSIVNARPGWAVACATLFTSVFWSVRHLSFLSDDFILVKQAAQLTPASLRPLFTTAGGDGFFRPAGYLSLAATAALERTLTGQSWPLADPVLWHSVALAIHAANAAMVVPLALRFGLPAFEAFLAGALFAVHGTHPEAVVWIAGRFDELAVFFLLAGMLLFAHACSASNSAPTPSRMPGAARWAGPAFQAAALVCFAAAALSKESAFVFPLLVLIYVYQARVPWQRVIPAAALAAALFVYRWIVVGGIGGYVDASGRATVFSLGFLSTLKVLFVRLWTSLYFPINWSREPDIALGLFSAAAVAALLWLAARGTSDRTMRAAFAALLISILPPLHLLGGAADLSGGRLLYLPSIWFCLFLAAALARAPRWRAAIGILLLMFHTAVLVGNLRPWGDASQQVEQICAASPGSPQAGLAALPRLIQGVPAFGNGYAECVEFSAARTGARPRSGAP